jgi:glycosyltransferase involved in cell wall biosynthesis
MRLAVWSPLPPSTSGIADYTRELLPLLARKAQVVAVVETKDGLEAPPEGCALATAEEAPPADLHLYELGNSPAHAYVYRAAIATPGVAVLHEWSLHHVVLRETVERGDVARYLREMRRAHGEAGSFVGRQVARALGGAVFPALYPLNDRVLEGSLAVVGLTRFVTEGVRKRAPGRPVLHLPHHVSLPEGTSGDKGAARRALGIPEDALVVTAPGLATGAKRLGPAIRAVGALKERFPKLLLVIAGEAEKGLGLEALAEEKGLGKRVLFTGRLRLPEFVRHIEAADVVLSLRFPSHGEISGALLRALGIGRPVLVTGGTPAADEFPEGVVVPIDPGRYEEADLEAFLGALLARPDLRDRIGALARAHVRALHGIEAEAEALLAFLDEVLARKASLEEALVRDRIPEGTLLGFLMEEVRSGARELGLPGLRLGLEPLLSDLAGEEPR